MRISRSCNSWSDKVNQINYVPFRRSLQDQVKAAERRINKW